MPAICVKCHRVNPVDAAYCYHDGSPLSNGHTHGAPVAAGKQAFPRPFVFPSGRQCRTFDELALAIQDDWKEGRNLLEQGYLEQFLGGLGRVDLARAARDAARSPDKDRGLDDLLDKLPTDALQSPRLAVAPLDVNLGVLPIGTDHRFELRLQNRGMRLLRGSITTEDSAWLALGDAGQVEKLFQFGSELTIPVRVVGKHLRAGAKQLEGRLVIDSNGGAVTVIVRADVPVKPFPEGVLRGATTPRQIAERAKAAPKEAAAYFEKGAVAQWYRDNGWTYPVQGETSSGLGAVQQFFEALGLTPPPKVEVSVRHVNLAGAVGERLDYPLEVKTPEKRPVYAYGVSNQPWLKVGRAKLEGRVATLPLIIASVPDRPGEKLQADVTVTANGNQRFGVTVALTVDGKSKKPRSAAALPAANPFDFDAPADVIPVAAPAGAAAPAMGVPVATPYAPPAEVVPVAPPPSRTSRLGNGSRRESPSEERRRPVAAIPIAPSGAPWWAHLIPVGMLFVALMGVFAADLLRKAPAPIQTGPPPEVPFGTEPLIEARFHDNDEEVMLAENGNVKPEEQKDLRDTAAATWFASMRFGLTTTRDQKKLTFETQGLTNNTVVRLDGQKSEGWIFGERPFKYKRDGRDNMPQAFKGQWKDGERSVAIPADTKNGKGEGRKSIWVYPNERIEITQFVEVIAGEQSRQLDTCLVRYLIENRDTRSHRVGLRFMLDTFIGGNDGVPFTIPGQDQLCDTTHRFTSASEVPDYIEAWERPDAADPGTVAKIQFRLGTRIEPPSRVTLGAWPNPELARVRGDRRCLQEKTGWEVPVYPIKSLGQGDSCVVMYWDEKTLEPGQKRELGFAYGLGRVASDRDAGGRLGLSVAGRFVPGGEFTITALVNDPRPGEKLTLTLPEGFQVVGGALTQDVPPVPPGATRQASPVTWKVKASKVGKATLKVESSAGASQGQEVVIKSTSIFD